MAPTPSLPLENLMPWAPPRTVVGRPLGLPGPRRRGALGPREVRGAPHRRDDHPTSEPPGPAHVRRPRQARRGPRAGRRGRRRCGRIQRRAPTDDALRARARPARGMLRPPPRAPRAVRAARLQPGREAPGRTGPPSLRGPSPSGMDSRGRRRGATRIHGRRRATSRRVLRNRETAHEEDPGRTRVDPPGTGSPPDRTEGPALSSGGPRRLCERREDLLVQRPDGRTPARGGPDVLDLGDDDKEPHWDEEAHPAHGHDRVRRWRAVLVGRGVPCDPRGDPPGGPRPPPGRRDRFRTRDPTEGPTRSAHPLPERPFGFRHPGAHEGRRTPTGGGGGSRAAGRWSYVSSSIRRMFFTNSSFDVVEMRRSNSLSFRIVSTK